MTTASMDFPNGCLTSTYVLSGFEDFAYIVCTVAPMPGTQNEVLRERSAVRLRNAERDLRYVSLVVSLDLEKSELFMFYRKSDLLRDQKVLIGKIGPVLRSNHLMKSYNSGGKAVHLLKPEQSRIYGLFTKAILSSVLPICLAGKDTMSLGPRAFMRRETSPLSQLNLDGVSDRGNIWRFCDIDIQILETGKVLVTSTTLGGVAAHSMTDLIKIHSSSHFHHPKKLVLCLAPIGQVARYTDRRIGTPASTVPAAAPGEGNNIQKEEDCFEAAKQRVWQEKLQAWLTEHISVDQMPDQITWIEVEIPTTTPTTSESPSDANHITWRKIKWPAELCFCVATEYLSISETESEDSWNTNDPWEFIENWSANARDRADEISKKERENSRDQHLDDHQSDFEVSEDDLQFGYTPHFQSHGPTDFPPSQLMYPTPPDGALAQATPGMSSYDGIDMTPANLARPMADLRGSTSGDNVAAGEDMRNVGVGSGFYDDDEDLFEDMPDEKFGPAGVADEPNWDFFDQPDFDMPDVDASDEQHDDQIMGDGDGTTSYDRNSRAVLPSHKVGHDTEPQKDFDSNNHIGPDHVQSGTHAEEPNELLSPSSGRKDVDIVETPKHELEPPSAQVPIHGQPSLEELIETSPRLDFSRRRSSVYESISTNFPNDSRDGSYFADGKYWFNNGDRDDPRHPLPPLAQLGLYKKGLEHRRGTPSVSTSDSDMSLGDEGDSAAQNGKLTLDGRRPWIEYTPATMEPASSGGVEFDILPLEREATEVIRMLQSSDHDLPMLHTTLHRARDWRRGIGDEVQDLTTVAQIVVDELSQTSFQRFYQDLFTIQSPNKVVTDLHTDLCKSDSTWERADLESLCQAGIQIDIEDISSRIDKIENYRILLSRSDHALTAFPTIKPLWDSLSLQPAGGRKDITAYCLHPAGGNVADGCNMFLARLSEIYLNCNFGAHAIGQLSTQSTGGIIGWSSDESLMMMCDRIGMMLVEQQAMSGTVMIYMINPSVDLTSCVRLCEVFYRIVSHYRGHLGGKLKPNDVALQIIPMSFVASPDTIVVPTQDEYLDLAIEVYNRCPPSDPGDNWASCGSAMVLAESMHRSVEFDLTTEAMSPLARAGECLHVAYSHSSDKRWVTAAWTDEHGYRALTMSYCLRSRGSNSSRPLSHVIQEIWETSHDLMAKHRNRWRLVVAKDGPYEAEEINDWLFHANSIAKDKKTPCSLILISINLNPLLTLEVPPTQPKPAAQGPSPSQPSKDYGTPNSTPQAANTTSPEQILGATPIPTPGGPAAVAASSPPEHAFDPSADMDLTLNDATEDSWCVSLSFGLNQSRNILDVRPAMASGYLIKRRGTKDEDGVVSLGVNLIHTPIPAHQQAAREDLLKEIIVQYRGLATLTTTRGCLVDRAKECVPWHIATAVKGARVLGLVF